MKALEHIQQLRASKDAEQSVFQRFADEHLCEEWLESLWKRLMAAFDDTERTAALAEAQREYERIAFVKEMNEEPKPSD
jgi:hypothetical protein